MASTPRDFRCGDQAGGAVAVRSAKTMLVCGGSTVRPGRPARPVGEAGRQRVVVGEAVDVVVERVQRRRGDDAGLAHAAADHLAPAVRAGDERARADQRRADRRAEALREADRDLIERRRDRARRRARIAAERDRGVEEARAVEVGRQAVPLARARIAASR